MKWERWIEFPIITGLDIDEDVSVWETTNLPI
jgi:hypothetical protein